jgi:cardiolipin synthase A/B
LVDGEPAFRRICEAIEGARHRVWATVTFMWPGFQMPDGRGSALDVLDRAATRGVDVRLIFWRPDEETAGLRRNAFWGAPVHFDELRRRRSRVRIRWDRAHPGFCQHQKTWLIDADTEFETAFVGGINLNPHSVRAPGHDGEGENHDAYVELSGPSVVDVHHNFVQRWNEASERDSADGHWNAGGEADLSFPISVPTVRGTARIQIQRTTHPGRYTNDQAVPGGARFDVALGERSILAQYGAAIQAARRTIYLENQYLEVAMTRWQGVWRSWRSCLPYPTCRQASRRHLKGRHSSTRAPRLRGFQTSRSPASPGAAPITPAIPFTCIPN